MALDSNGRIGKWSHMRSNLEEYSWGLGSRTIQKIQKIGKWSRNGQKSNEIGRKSDRSDRTVEGNLSRGVPTPLKKKKKYIYIYTYNK